MRGPAGAMLLLCAVAAWSAAAEADSVDAARLLQHFDDLVLHRSGDDTKSGKVRKWTAAIRVQLAGSQTGFYGPDAIAALRRAATVAGIRVEEVPAGDANANYVMEFLDTAFLIANGRTASCVATSRVGGEGRIVFVRLQLNYRNPLGMRRCVDHEIGHSLGLGHSHVADSVMSYVSGQTTMTALDRLIIRALYDKRIKLGTLRLPALEQAIPVLAELAGGTPGPVGYPDNAAQRMAQDAENGDVWTQNQLGAAYESGKGRPQDHRAALHWYRRAAEAGNSYGMFKLGWFATKGLGQPADQPLAVSWYRRAAALGHVTAQNNLGVHLRDGRGATADAVEAMMWFELAARRGHQLGTRNRDELAAKLAAPDLDEARRRAEAWQPGK